MYVCLTFGSRGPLAPCPARTVGGSRLKFVHAVGHELRTIHVEKRGRWGVRLARGTSWKTVDFSVALTWGKWRAKSSKNVKMGQTWVPSRDDSSATAGPIGMGQTRVGRELIKLANGMWIWRWRVPRARLMALSMKNCVFLDIFQD